MDRRLYPWMFLLAGLLLGMAASGGIALRAQDRGRTAGREAGRPAQDVPVAATADREPPRAGPASVQDVLLRPYHFPFNRPTSLAQVCLKLKQSLGVSVVLDVAALDRQNVTADDTVQLDLDGVRLKTGLKLLLDQVGLTYHVVGEDNLLILTDRQGSEDPLDRIWNELRTVHRELHDVQDAVDELTDAFYGEEGDGPRVRKPTIIEEKPEPAPDGAASEPKAPGPKPGDVGPPDHPRGGRPRPSRIPLAGPPRPL